MNQLGIHAQVWVGDWQHADCERALSAAARIGYDFIEVPLLDPQRMDAAFTRAKLDEYGLGATASLGLTAETDVSSEDMETVKRGEALLNQALAAAHDIGVTHLCGVIYSALQKYMRPACERGLENAIGVIERLATRAEDCGIVLGLETVNRYETNVINTAVDTRALIERIGADNLFVHLDSYHMNIEENSMADALAACGSRLGYVHVGESHRGYLGSGSIDFENFFRGLVRCGYDGPIAFESFSSAVVDPKLSSMLGVWRNLWDDSDDLARHALTHMRTQLESARAACGARTHTRSV